MASAYLMSKFRKLSNKIKDSQMPNALKDSLVDELDRLADATCTEISASANMGCDHDFDDDD